MGAGARFAAERDRWPEHWRVADLDMEQDGLLAMLEPGEELRTVVPCMRSSDDGEQQVLVGVTDRRVVLITRRREAGSAHIVDVTECASTVARGNVVPHRDGHLAFDIDDESMARVWDHIDQVAPA